jgi:chromosome segregation protein
MTRQQERLGSEYEEVTGQIGELKELVSEARTRQEKSIELLADLNNKRTALQGEREQLTRRLLEAERVANEDRVRAQEIQLKIQSRKSTRENALAGLERMRAQLNRFDERKVELEKQLEDAAVPIAGQKEELQAKLKDRVLVETRLQEARKALEDVDSAMRALEHRRADQELAVNAAREALDEARMASQEITLRREALFEQFSKTEYELGAIGEQMPEEADVDQWEQKLENITSRIGRLGPINLAAIDESKEQSERQQYLDAQNTDLEGALQTLENAIRKIDRETRTRFKETYDRVNAGLKQNFPRLFGGGHAYLELSDEDLLTAGVSIMARPPGKRNSSINLLSGGEKALTAVALVFAIFQLNPAPFCLLDEVDAPLDDANVTRFCEIVREMSEKVQFLFITHNKVTMEMANQLTGVTMQEPGVSRLVSVDVEEAVQMSAM